MAHVHRRALVRMLAAGAVLAVSSAAVRRAGAQAVTVEPLIVAQVAELPPPPAFIRLVRMTLQPDASVPTHSHPGPEFALLESGSLSVSAAGELAVVRAGGGAEWAPAGSALVLAAGDRVAFPAGVAFAFSNLGEEPAELLTLVVLPAGPGRPAGAEVLATPATGDEGVRSLPLGDAVAPGWPAPPIALTVERVTVPASEALPATPDPVMLAVERGELAFALRSGEYEVSRSGGAPRPRSGVGTSEQIGPGDAVFFPGGVNALPRSALDGDLVVLRVSFAGAAVGTPVPEAAATPAAGSPAAFGAGDRVVVAEDGVRLRTEPSTESGVVAELAAGSVLVVTGLPVAGSDGSWYPVTDEAGDASGFVSEAFLASGT